MEYKITLKGKLTHIVALGDDIFGNITRLDNVLDSLESKLQDCAEQIALKLHEKDPELIDEAPDEGDKPERKNEERDAR
jgi:hypothetical protein